jgi:hypothetical protein
MKAVTARQSYRDAKLVDDLPANEQLLVTSTGKPKFIVTRCGERPVMTRKLAESLATNWKTPKNFDSVAFLKSLR